MTTQKTLPPNDNRHFVNTYLGIVGVFCRDNTIPTQGPQNKIYVDFHFCDVSWFCVSGGTCAAPSCINSATDRHGYVYRFTKLSEITQCNGHYAVQGHSRSPMLVPIKSSYDILLVIVINTKLPPILTVSKWLIIGHIFVSERERLTLTLSLG